jgi:RNA polymerase sigma-70 factor, ECF subfamily
MEPYRPLMRLILRSQLRRPLEGKVDLSGVIQQTMVEAHANEQALNSWPEERRLGWLRIALLNNLRDELRKLHRDQAATSLNEEGHCGNGTLADLVSSEQTSPGQGATRNEQLLRLARALDGLLADQRRAIELHHLEGMSLVETAKEMNRSLQSVVGLVFRGLKQLRSELHTE